MRRFSIPGIRWLPLLALLVAMVVLAWPSTRIPLVTAATQQPTCGEPVSNWSAATANSLTGTLESLQQSDADNSATPSPSSFTVSATLSLARTTEGAGTESLDTTILLVACDGSVYRLEPGSDLPNSWPASGAPSLVIASFALPAGTQLERIVVRFEAAGACVAQLVFPLVMPPGNNTVASASSPVASPIPSCEGGEASAGVSTSGDAATTSSGTPSAGAVGGNGGDGGDAVGGNAVGGNGCDGGDAVGAGATGGNGGDGGDAIATGGTETVIGADCTPAATN